MGSKFRHFQPPPRETFVTNLSTILQGLTPEEITQCLRAVQAHNGLAKIAAGSAAAVASTVAATSSSSLSTSKAALLGKLTRKYGAASLLLSLLGYGYLRFRQRLTEQLVVEHVADHVKRRAKRNAQVGALLAVIEHQQSQYKQVWMGGFGFFVSPFLADFEELVCWNN